MPWGAAVTAVPLWSPHVQGSNAARGCDSTTRTAGSLKFGREEVAAKVSCGVLYVSAVPLAPPLIFIEHTTGLHYRRPIITLI
jgi:hypothetical protein